ncbi:MAG: paraquat-inducible protein A [Thermodesulfobacteriota bacterium]
MTRPPPTAALAGFVSCGTCGLLCRPAEAGKPGECPRCGEPLAFRLPESIERTWAYVVAAAVCYLPANLLPVMTTTTIKATTESTILSGVIHFYTTGSWFLALIVLVASVIIPLGKLGALAYLLVTVMRRSTGRPLERARLFRMLKAIGRWSMLDVFVVMFVVALVRFEPFMSVVPGPGVPFFAAVVILTILAADAFDPRLIWDPAGKTGGTGG